MSFPTQTLGKCGKMVPVMVIGAIADRKSYTFRDYALALLLTFGCFLFLLTGVRTRISQEETGAGTGSQKKTRAGEGIAAKTRGG